MRDTTIVPGWITTEDYARVSDDLAARVFCPDFQVAYAAYLATPPVWERRMKHLQQYLLLVYVGTYHLRDGLVVEHQVYEIPRLLQEHRDAPKQQHYLLKMCTRSLSKPRSYEETMPCRFDQAPEP